GAARPDEGEAVGRCLRQGRVRRSREESGRRVRAETSRNRHRHRQRRRAVQVRVFQLRARAARRLRGAAAPDETAVRRRGCGLPRVLQEVLQGSDDGRGDRALGASQQRSRAEMYVEAVNEALRGIPPEKVRYHTCYGINEGPRIHEADLSDVVGYMLKVNAGAYSFEAANPRHEHEYHLWESVRL